MSTASTSKEPNKCRHFNGIQNDRCKAGKVYWEITHVKEEGRFGCATRLPCLAATEEHYPCDCLSRYTDEETSENDRQIKETVTKMLQQIAIARPAIVAHVGEARKRQDVADSLVCPVCKEGTLHYSYCGSYNKHIHARCTTPGCCYWGE